MIDSLPYQFAKQHGILLHQVHGNWALACKETVDMNIILEVSRYSGEAHPLTFMSTTEFDRLLEQHYHAQAKGAMNHADLEKDLQLNDAALELQYVEDLLDSDQEAPIIRLLNALIAQALKEKASDIHIETYQHHLIFRFRIDGTLEPKMTLSQKFAAHVVSRIKVMSKLNIAEKRLPQDGRMSVQIAGRQIDVRVSTLPSNYGERVVLRLLDKQTTALKLDDLGFNENQQVLMRQLMQNPHGIILVTGPTGAGKTTTLYAVISELNHTTHNILTVEDPIEYDLPGIGQTQVNAKIGMTFAKGLRAILRQDPDVVMVGEIRDVETAEIAIQASLTGHLMLSTLHTNTALGAITRLRDMGIPSYLIGSTLEGVVAQRLVRLLCPDCKEGYIPDQGLCYILDINPSAAPKIYRAVGCPACHGTGYKGRSAIYEIIPLDESLKRMIHTDQSELQLRAYAYQHYPSIRQDGIAKILSGETTVEDVVRVTELST